MMDLEAIIDARLDEAVGVAGLRSGAPTGDDDLEAQLEDLYDWAGASADELAGEVVAREGDVVGAAETTGAVDERRLVRLDSAMRGLDRRLVDPTEDAARAAHDTARRTLVAVIAAVTGLAGVAAWLGHALRAVGVHARNGGLRSTTFESGGGTHVRRRRA